MMEGWKKVRLIEVAPYWNGKIENKELDENNFISAENMFPDKGGVTESSYVSCTGKATSFKSKDVLISNIRPYFKKIWLADKNGGCSNDVIVFRTNQILADSTFIYYYLSKDDFFDFMMAGANGTKMPRGNKKAIPQYKINLPPLETQRKIASILSAYDDLIENNLKRIKLLEEQAQQTYEEWFVRFKFPGYENVAFDELSGLPEGWEKVKLGEFTDVLKGKNITKATVVRGNVPVVAGGLSPAYFHNKPNTTNPIITVSASGANAGFVNLYLQDIWASDCSFIDSKMTKNLFFTFCTLIYKQKFIYHLQKGAAQPHVYPKDLKKVEIVIPTKDILQEFEDMVSKNFNVKRNLFNQNQHLKEARDILLPRLMSGLIDVDSLDIINNLKD